MPQYLNIDSGNGLVPYEAYDIFRSFPPLQLNHLFQSVLSSLVLDFPRGWMFPYPGRIFLLSADDSEIQYR